ncbi:hypothetical protein [Streptomyces sp. SID2888]|uniref:hypothetical protein n=1 Tax=Streptomyces sp. SID2888 TaxID=2690256 RepID=UPI0013711893|nr:hypothetical protein [Streptomyces sp. SID2888]MYV48154.1 hypothetical protein [Streptomyces sp. SID2888]
MHRQGRRWAGGRSCPGNTGDGFSVGARTGRRADPAHRNGPDAYDDPAHHDGPNAYDDPAHRDDRARPARRGHRPGRHDTLGRYQAVHADT